MRRTIILSFMICTGALAFAQTDASSSPQPEASPTASPAAPEPSAAPAAQPQSEAESLAQVAQLSAKLEEANGTIDSLRSQATDLQNKADDAEKRAQDARAEADSANAAASAAEAKAADSQAIADASQAQVKEAQDAATAAAARADALSADADKMKARVAELETAIAEIESSREALNGKLASFGALRIDSSAFKEVLLTGFTGSKQRLGKWKLSEGIISQTDKRQFFSRLTFPLVQSATPVLYSFETRTGPKGWVGTGIHFFAEGVRKPKGYGEGTSLLVWLTRDAKVRGNDGTYLQVYRSDDDISMERVLDAKIQERLDAWNRIELLYEPANEFIVLAVNGSVRAAYRTYFGIGSGVTMSLRTLGEGVQFRNLEVRR